MEREVITEYTRIYACDPGGTTGWAFFNPARPESFESWQSDGEGWLRELTNVDGCIGRDSIIVCERFTIRQNTHKLSADAFEQTTDTIGALRYIAAAEGCPFIRQTPAQAKAFATDDKLRKLGWYTPGLPHGNDAARHLLTYLAGVRYTPILQRLVSEEGPA